MGKSGSHNLTAGMKKLLDVFGMEWRMATGEAEAELAYLNQIGVIDAIMTNDVDALVFGARTIIRNPSLTLTGNKSHPALNAEGKASKHHVMIYSAEDILSHPEVALSRGGLILFALLSGGDYGPGLKGFGPQIAHALARCGFGDRLMAAYNSQLGGNFHQSLKAWRMEINLELRANSRGLLPRRYPSLTLPENFPDQQILENYANPMCSARIGRQGGGALRDGGNLNLSKAATFCENHFDEWGHKSAIIKRFRDLLWEASVMTVLRRAALDVDEKEKDRRIAAGMTNFSVRGPLRPSQDEEVGTPPTSVKRILDANDVDRYAAAFVRREPRVPATGESARPLVQRIVGTRQHVSTDGLLEYRVEIDPTQLVNLTSSGIRGKHSEPPTPALDDFHDGTEDDTLGGSQSTRGNPRKTAADPFSSLLLWIPATVVRQVHPGLVEDFEASRPEKTTRRTKGTKRKARVDNVDEQQQSATPSQDAAAANPSRAQSHVVFHETSNLPQRDCGFIFTFPNSDDPDMCMWSDEDTTTSPELPELPSVIKYLDRAGAGAKEKNRQPREGPLASRKRGEAPRSGRPAASEDHMGGRELFGELNKESRSLSKYNRIFDQILGIAPGSPGHKGKRPAASDGTARTETSGLRHRREQPARIACQTVSNPSGSDGASRRVTLASFPPISPLGSQSRSRTCDATNASASRDPLYSRQRDWDVIDLSDSEDDVMSQHPGPAKRRKLNVSSIGDRRYPYMGPISQDSSLSYRSFSDSDDVVDLT